MEDTAGIRLHLHRLGIYVPRYPRRSAGDASIPDGGCAVYPRGDRALRMDARHWRAVADLAGMEGRDTAWSADVPDGLRLPVLGGTACAFGDCGSDPGGDSSLHHHTRDHFSADSAADVAARVGSACGNCWRGGADESFRFLRRSTDR